MFLSKGAESIYKDHVNIHAEKDSFESEAINKENIEVYFFEEGKIKEEDPYVLLVVTSKTELIATEDFLVKEYFGWGE